MHGASNVDHLKPSVSERSVFTQRTHRLIPMSWTGHPTKAIVDTTYVIINESGAMGTA